jgi:release factor glutamine methyltransferase
MLTLLEIIRRSTEFLESKGVENPRLNAELLIGRALNLARMQLYLQFERLLTEPELERIRPLMKRRSQREPLQYILGDQEFFRIHLKVDRRALIPRPETEQLCELITQRLTAPPATILDLGTGSGAIALALGTFYPQASVVAVDVSAEALALARENAAALGLEARTRLIQSDWFAGLEGAERFELIAANPPYLSAAETSATAPEVQAHEPGVALSPGPDGTEALVRIFAEAPRFLTDSGLLAVETGPEQHPRVQELATAAGFTRVESSRDLNGRPRHFLAWR